MSDYASEFSIRRLWIIFGASMFVMFGALLFFGYQVYQSKPPIPGLIGTASGQILYTGEDIERGQNVWQSIGGMQQGSIWGHGSYVAPDWSADWLHREAVALRDGIAGTAAGLSTRCPSPTRRGLARSSSAKCAPTATIRKPPITVSDQRARAITATAAHFERSVHQPHAGRPAFARALRHAAECRPDGG